jgi:uncharacterized SAM-binding protein YcdF (DUF218 family)
VGDIDYIIVLSASRGFVTLQRLNAGIDLVRRKYPKKTIVTCGKYHSKLMKEYLIQNGIKKYFIQRNSANTYEDAFYVGKLIKDNTRGVVIVTSPTHLRRSYNTFRKVLKCPVYCYSSNIFLSFDSILLPTGLVGFLVNAYRDYKYNY